MNNNKGKEVDTITRYSPLEIPKIIKAHYKARVPCNFVAEPSTVKSEGTMQTAKVLSAEEGREYLEWNRATMQEKAEAVSHPEKYFVFADVRASETDIGELRLQDMRNGESYITFKYNILFEALSKKEAKGILFFDEMNLAPNMIKAQFYKIINDGAIGDIPLSKNVLCVSAGNEAEHSRGVTDDAVPLVLRRGNYFLRPLSAEEYTEFAVKAGQHEWITGYLGFQPNDVHNIAYDLPDGVGQPCPRTWTRLSQVLRSNPDVDTDDVQMFATGLVGQGVAKKFTAYVRSARQVKLNDVLENPKLVREYEQEEELSLVYAIIAGVTEKYRHDKKLLGKVFGITLQFQRAEFGAFLLRSLKAVDEQGFMKNVATVEGDVVQKVVERYGKFIIKD